MIRIKVLVVRPTLAEWIEKQKDLLPENIELVVPKEGTDEEIEELIQDVEIVVCTRLSAEAARKGKKLKLIQKTGAGVDAIPFEAIREDIIVANTSGANPVPLAEGTIALMISLAKKITQKNSSFPNRVVLRGTELRGKKVGIIGLGNIGVEVAKRLQAFEMKILGIKRTPSEKLKEENIHYFKEPDLRRKKYNIDQRMKILQKKRDTLKNGYEYKKSIQELKKLSGKRELLTRLACHRISKQVCTVVKSLFEQGYEIHIAIGKLQGLRIMNYRGNGKGNKFRGRISKFPYSMLKEFIFYKSRELGVCYFGEINESWTSKTCHRCDSTNTKRPTQTQFICNDCGLQYNADVNGAINIAKRYWFNKACGKCQSLNTKPNYDLGEINCSDCNNSLPVKENKRRNKEHITMIFSFRKFEGKNKSQDHCSIPQGTSDSPSCNESAGTKVHLKVEEARKRKNHEGSTRQLLVNRNLVKEKKDTPPLRLLITSSGTERVGSSRSREKGGLFS